MQHAREAVRLYRSAVASEQQKLRLGMSTFFDVLFVEDELSNALLSEVSAQARYAEALVRLRFETGTLLPDEGCPPARLAARLHVLPLF